MTPRFGIPSPRQERNHRAARATETPLVTALRRCCNLAAPNIAACPRSTATAHPDPRSGDNHDPTPRIRHRGSSHAGTASRVFSASICSGAGRGAGGFDVDRDGHCIATVAASPYHERVIRHGSGSYRYHVTEDRDRGVLQRRLE